MGINLELFQEDKSESIYMRYIYFSVNCNIVASFAPRFVRLY